MSPTYRIADLTLDTGRRQLLRDGKRIALGPLTYKFLLALVDKAPEVVTHDDVVDAVWDGRTVSPETIKQRVKLLRDALADDAERPLYIDVVRGQGYRLIPRAIETDTATPHRNATRTLLAAAAGLLFIMAAAAVWFSWPQSGQTPDDLSIAVLSFTDLGPEQDDDYFAQGISEEIRNLLATSTPLRVIARTSSFSFKGQDTDITSIAKALKVSHVLEGAVRRGGARIRITVQLVDASDSTQIWSGAFEEEMDDILKVQRKVATSVANALKANMLGENPLASLSRERVDPQAFDYYLRGQQQLHLYTAASLVRAEEYYQQAIELDPTFIPAYYKLGLAYVLQVVDVQVPIEKNRIKLRDVVRRGLERAPDNAGLIGLSGQLARYDGDNDLAERRLSHAMAIDPANMPVRMIYAMFLTDQGNPEKSLEVERRSLEIDPLNPLLNIGKTFTYIDLWNAREAMAAASHLRQIPNTSELPLLAVTKLLLLGDIAASIRDSRAYMRGVIPAGEPAYAYPLWYFYLGDLASGDAAMRLWRRYEGTVALDAVEVQQLLAHGQFAEARTLAVEIFRRNDGYTGHASDNVVARLATDALIERGEAQDVVDLIEEMAPIYARYKLRPDIDPRDFSPAPFRVKSGYSSFPALYFPDYIHALRAAGDDASAETMLGHFEAILHFRRQRGLYLEERYAAEALALRGKYDSALDALEQAERDRTIYRNWQIFLLHNSIFSDLRNHPRYKALIERVRLEMARQLAKLAAG